MEGIVSGAADKSVRRLGRVCFRELFRQCAEADRNVSALGGIQKPTCNSPTQGMIAYTSQQLQPPTEAAQVKLRGLSVPSGPLRLRQSTYSRLAQNPRTVSKPENQLAALKAIPPAASSRRWHQVSPASSSRSYLKDIFSGVRLYRRSSRTRLVPRKVIDPTRAR